MSDMLMRFPGGKPKAFTMSYDDGVETDKRLIEIMDRYGLKGTFNINSGLFAPEGTVYPKDAYHRRMTEKQVVELYTNSGHEVGVHAVTHPFLEELPAATAAAEVVGDRRRLEQLFGGTIRGMAYPYGTYNDAVVEIVKNAGIIYSRTTISTENFNIPDDWLRLPATCHHINPKLMELADRFIDLQIWGKSQMFYLWGHSYEFERDNNWEVIEEFAEKIGGREDIWYATNIEIFDYITAFKQLRFNVDMTYVENPTNTDLWLAYNGKIYEIKHGERVTIK